MLKQTLQTERKLRSSPVALNLGGAAEIWVPWKALAVLPTSELDGYLIINSR
jgi:hypothetical protein